MTYRTLGESSTFTDEPVKGSRFAALVAPAASEEDAMGILQEATARWNDASHHTWAYRLRNGHHRSSDDGEPGGSAGRPILAQIDGHGLVDVAVVVVRWFGGTKLGVGGLIRAYGGCAGRALDRAQVVQIVPTHLVTVAHPYDDTGAIQGLVGSMGLEVVRTQWDASVTVEIRVPEPELESLMQRIADRTSGRAVATVARARSNPNVPVEGDRE